MVILENDIDQPEGGSLPLVGDSLGQYGEGVESSLIPRLQEERVMQPIPTCVLIPHTLLHRVTGSPRHISKACLFFSFRVSPSYFNFRFQHAA